MLEGDVVSVEKIEVLGRNDQNGQILVQIYVGVWNFEEWAWFMKYNHIFNDKYGYFSPKIKSCGLPGP